MTQTKPWFTNFFTSLKSKDRPILNWQQILLIGFVLFGMNSLHAQTCSHPAAVSNGAELQLGPDTNGDSVPDYVDANGNGIQNNGDGAIYDYRTNCVGQSIGVVGGGTYGFYLKAGNAYTFTACPNTTTETDYYPVVDVWAGLAAADDFVVASTPTTIGGQTCATITLNTLATCDASFVNELYFKVSSQNDDYGVVCANDWEPFDMAITCNSCTMNLSASDSEITISTDSDPTSTCTAAAISVPVPTVSDECDGSTLFFDAGEVLPSGDITVLADGATISVTTGSGYMIPNAALAEVSIDAGLEVGTYNVQWAVENCVGDVSTSNQIISVEPVMACRSGMNISLSPETCSVAITPGLMLPTLCGEETDYTVTIEGETSNILTKPGNYNVTVTHNGSGLSCWGVVTAEDKSAPVCNNVDLPDLFSPCNSTSIQFQNLVTTDFTDCTAVTSVSFFDKETAGCGTEIFGTDLVPSSNFTFNTTSQLYEGIGIYAGFAVDKVISRVWTPTDTNGMVGESCQQNLYIFRPTNPSSILAPEDAVIDCSAGTTATEPANLAANQVPHFVFDENGTPEATDTIRINNVCSLVATHKDNVFPVAQACGSERKIFREWSVLDWCAVNVGGEVSLRDFFQEVKSKDLTAPDYSLSAIDFNTNNDVVGAGDGTQSNPDIINTAHNACAANVTFDLPTIANAATLYCSDLSYYLEVYDASTNTLFFGHNYDVAANDITFTQSIQSGNYYVSFYVKNDCNNLQDVLTRYFNVVDVQGPIVACTPATVTLNNTTDGSTQICAHNVINDADTDDNCSSVTYAISRTGVAGTFTECFDVSCSDLGSNFMVHVQATDYSGNLSEVCWTTVTLEDKNGTCQCRNTVPADFTVRSLPLNFPLNENGEHQLVEANIFSTIPTAYTVGLSRTNSAFGNTILYNCQDTVSQRVYVEYTDGTTTNICYEDISLNDGNVPRITDCSDLFRDSEGSPMGVSNTQSFTLNAASLLANSPELQGDWGNAFLTDNCTSLDQLVASMNFIVTITDGTNQTIETGSSIDLSATLSSPGLVSGMYTVELLVTDNSGNKSSICPSIDVRICAASCRPAIKGKITSEESITLQDVEVELLGSDQDVIMTDDNGEFEFEALSGNDYTVKVTKNTDYLNGVSTFDLVKMGQHILGSNLLDSPYKMIAGDANNDGRISTIDIVLMRQLILHQITELPDVDSWRFIDANYVFPHATNPWFEQFPEEYLIQNIDGDMNLGFVGVKVGDLDCSAQVNINDLAEERSNEAPLMIQMNNELVQKGEEFRVILTAPEVHTVQGLQFTLGFDTEKAAFVELSKNTTSLMADSEIGLQFQKEGMLTASWMNTDTKEATIRPLFVLKMKALQNITLDEVFELSSRYTQAEAYNTTDEVLDLELTFGNQAADPTAGMNFQLFQNKPNPFSGHTTIGFYLPTAQEATLVVYDVAGKLIYDTTNDYQKGYNELILKKEDLTKGILYYQIETDGFSQTRKMIVLD